MFDNVETFNDALEVTLLLKVAAPPNEMRIASAAFTPKLITDWFC